MTKKQSTASWTTLQVTDAVLQLYETEPAADPAGTVLMIHENRGMVPYMLAVAEELAEAGYRVVAPDLLSRIGGTHAYADDPTSVTTRQIDSATHLRDLTAVYDAIVSAEGETPAVVGFCFGAEMGWSLITERRSQGAVLFYGIGPSPESVGKIASPIYAVYAEDDPRVNDTFATLGVELAKLDAPYLVESFRGTKHAFHDRTRPDRFHPACAAIVWERTLEFLAGLFDSGWSR